MDNSKIFIIFFIIFFFVFGRGLDFVVSGFNNINEQSQRVSKESVATDFYHSVNYGLNTINFELDNLVSNINTETKSTLDDIEIILTSINRRTNFVTTKESLALVSVPNFNFNITEQFAVTWYRTVSGLFKVNSLQFTVDSKSEELATLETTTTSGSLSLTGQAVDGVNEDEVSQSETSSNNQPTTPLETTTVSGSLSLTGQATTQNSTVREIVKETVVERVIQASGITLEDLQKLNNELRSEIYKLSSATNSQITNTYQVISATNNIDQLNGITMERINMTDSNVSGTNLNFNNGSISNLTGGSATFDTDTLYIDNINHRVGIGTTSPFKKLSVNGDTWISGDLTTNSITATSSISASYFNATDSTATSTFAGGLTVGTNKLVVDRSTNNVGIGTASPSQQLEITGDFEMPNTTFADQSGIIYKGANRFIHNFNYGDNGTVTTTGYNIFIGEESGNFSMGNTATAVGHASYNTAVGYRSLYSNTTGYSNIANGMYSLYANTTGANNTANGYASLYSNTTGNSNIGMGYQAGKYITDGTTANATGTYNIFLGRDTKALADGDTNEIVIGYNATGVGSNSVVLGADTITKTILKGNVGIGTASPGAHLHVVDQTTSAGRGLLLTQNSTDAAGAFMQFQKSRGTNASPTTVANGDFQGLFVTSPYDGSSYVYTTGAFGFKTSGAVTTGNVPTDFIISTGATTDSSINNERLRITSNGNVGIGTTSPFAKLSVKGAGTTTGINFQTTNSADTPLVTVLDSGNVGIGTAAPGAKLEVYGGNIIQNNGTYTLTQSAGSTITGSNHLILTASATYMSLNSPNNSMLFNAGNDATDYIGFFNGAGTTEYMRINNGGNVGVGTVSPSSILHVIQPNDTSGITIGGFTVPSSYLKIFNDSGGYSNINAAQGFRFQQAGTNIAYISSGTTDGFRLYDNIPLSFGATLTTKYLMGRDNTSGNFRFAYGGIISTDSNVKLTITPEGNIGIGTTSPFAKLSVKGAGTTTGINFQTTNSNDTPLVTVLDNGNVGIGTASPAYPLDVNGVIRSNNQFRLLNTNTATGYYLFGDTDDDDTGWISYDHSVNRMAFRTNAAEKMTILSSGNVGIGTTSPFAKLSVVGDVVADYFNATSTTATSTFAGGFSVGTNKLVVDRSTGNVGIGTASPTATLQVRGTAGNIFSIVNSAGNTAFTVDNSQLQAQFYPNTNLASPGITFNGDINTGINHPTADTLNMVTGGLERMRIDSAGNVGIGSTTPNYKLTVDGTVAFQSLVNNGNGYYVCANAGTGELATSTTACGASSERFKTNIDDLSYGLDTVMQLRPVSFDWKQDFIKNGTKQIGFIAEEVNSLIPEVIGHDDKGNIMNLDYPKLTSVLVNAIKELNTKISAIASSTPTVSTGAVDSILSYLESLGARFTAGVAYLKNVFVENLTIGSSEKPTGMTLYDKVTGEAYCLEVINGAMVNTPGECTSSVEQTQNNAEQTQNYTGPIITFTGNNPAVIEINTAYSDLGATAVDSHGNSLIVDAFGLDTIDTAVAGEYTVTYTVFDGTLTATSTRTVIVEETP